MRRLLRAVALLGLLVLVVDARGSEGPPPVLKPKTYASPSGEYTLFVNPSDQHGMGKGEYTLKRLGEIVWAGERPYTFWQSAVTDEGLVAGYAYSHGYQGWGAAGDGFGDLVVALISREGTELAREVTPRVAAGGWSCPPNRQPSPNGCFIQPDLGRFIVRCDGSEQDLVARGEHWWVYSLADGKRSGAIDLTSPPHTQERWYHAWDADAIPGTELSLVLWSRTDWRPNRKSDEGCRLAVVDRDGKEVWSREWTTEFNGPSLYNPWMLGDCDLTPATRFGNGKFVYLSRSQQAALTFEVHRGADGGWQVHEAGTQPEAVNFDREPRTTVDASPAEEPGKLELLGSVRLEGGDVPESLGIMDFEFDDRGRCGFLRHSRDGDVELMLLDPGAEDPIAAAVHVPLRLNTDDQSMPPEAGWVGGDRWVAVRGAYDRHDGSATPPTRAWIVDVGDATVTPIEGFEGPRPALGRAVVGGGEQGFAILASWEGSGIARYDSRGVKLWEASAGLSPQAAAIQPDGSTGVLVGIENVIQEYAKDGKSGSRIDLAKAIGATPNYVAGLAADDKGGWILHDFNGQPPVYRISADRTSLAGFTPRHPDGSTYRLYGDVRRAPDGRLWTSDHASLMRLDDQGVVDRVIGPRADTDTLDEIRAITVDGKGRLYALDGRSARTHVFDIKGKRNRVLRPEPKDFGVESGIGSIAVAGDGSVYCRPTSIGVTETRYLKFDSAGNRVGFQPTRCGEVCDEWFFRPGGQELLVLGYERAFLYGGDGELVRKIERRADEHWLEHPDDAAVAPDGSFVILARGSRDKPTSITIYSAAGEAIKTHEMIEGGSLWRVAASNTAAAAARDNLLVFVDRTTGKVKRFAVPLSDEGHSYRVPFFSPDGSELWIVDVQTRSVLRFRTPGA